MAGIPISATLPNILAQINPSAVAPTVTPAMAAAFKGAKTPKAKIGKLQEILEGLNHAFSSPDDAGMMGFGQGLLQASTPHLLTPVPMGEALGMGLAQSQAYQRAALANAMQRAVLPMAQAKTSAIVKALQKPDSYAGRTFADNLLGGQAAVSHDPSVVAGATQAQQAFTPHTVGAGQRFLTGAGAPLANVFGAPAPGTVQNPTTGQTGMAPGALPAIAQASGAQAAGAHAGAYPFEQGLKLTGQHHLTPGSWIAPTAPAPSIPPAIAALLGGRSGSAPPQMMAPSQARAAAQTGMQREVGVMQGLNNAARPGQQLPFQQATPQPQQPAAQQQGAPALGSPLSLSQANWLKLAQSQAQKSYEGFQKEAQDAVSLKAQIGNFNMAADAFTPGQFAETRAKFLNGLYSAGMISQKEMSRLGSAQEGAKLSIQMQALFTRQLGSREAAQVFSTMGNAVPNLTLSPNGIAKISSFMNGIADYNLARFQKAQQAYTAGDYRSVNKVTSQFIAHSNPLYFIMASAPPAVRKEMFDAMGAKGRPFLVKWTNAIRAGYAPRPGE